MNRIFLFVLAAVFVLTGCVTSAAKLTEISLGMNKSQVTAVLGSPHSVSARDGGTELLRYELSGRSAPILNPNAREFAEGYTVQLMDGKVVAFGRDDEFREITVRSK
jgi:SmpA / OmlA family